MESNVCNCLLARKTFRALYMDICGRSFFLSPASCFQVVLRAEFLTSRETEYAWNVQISMNSSYAVRMGRGL